MSADFLPHDFTDFTNGSMTISASGAPWNGTGYGWKIADGSSSSEWFSDSGLGGGAVWVKIDVGAGKKYLLDNFSVRSGGSGIPAIDFLIQGSNDDSNWDTLNTESYIEWYSNDTKNFVCDVRTTYYRYFRYYVTQGYGYGATKVGEMYLYGDLEPPPFPSGWASRKSVTLSRAAGAVTNYQMKLLVGESSGSGTNDVTATGCKTDFSDLRFTKADGTTLLDYWIESVSGTTPNQVATVWIKFDSIGTTSTTFYMYYGNASASAVSNGPNTFILFEDFNALVDGDIAGQNGWDGGANVAFDIQASTKYEGAKALTVDAINDGGTCRKIIPSGCFWNIWVEAHLMATNTALTNVAILNVAEGAIAEITGIDIGSSNIEHVVPGTWETVGVSASNNVWYKVKLAFDSKTTHKVWVDDVLKTPSHSTNFGNITTTVDTVYFRRWNNTAGAVFFDLLKIGQYLATEPAWGSWGSQEAVLTDWLYRKPITLSRASGAVTNYQMKLLVGESSGSGANDVLATGCKLDFSDLRFTTANGTTLLDYWIESVSGSSPNQVAIIWIEFDSIGTGATTFYMYYGNAGPPPPAVSNGVNTFIAFHDFNALSTAQLSGQDSWTGDTNHAVQETVVAEGMKAVIGSGNADSEHAFTNTGWRVFLEAKVRCSSTGTGTTTVSLNQTALGGITGFGLLDGSARMRVLDNTPWADLLTGTLANTWYLGRVEMTAANKVKGYVNGVLTDLAYNGEFTTYRTVTGNIDSLGIETWGLSAGTFGYFDCIKVGQFEVTGPAWGSWGAAQDINAVVSSILSPFPGGHLI